MRKRFLLLGGIFGAAIMAVSFNLGSSRASATVPGTNTLVSSAYGTTAASDHATVNSLLSADGQYVVYVSTSTNILNSTTSGSGGHIYLRNLATGSTSLVDVSTGGTLADGVEASDAISETGRYVAFSRNASNLIDGTTTATTYRQIYLRDTINNTTALISQTPSGALVNADSYVSGVSSDGRFILFTSAATNISSSATDGHTHLYMFDRKNSTYTVVDTKYNGTVPSGIAPITAQMSCDGSLVVFEDSATLTTQSALHYDVYLFDMRNGNSLIDLTASTNGAAFSPTISCNGNYIALASQATNLDPVLTTNPTTACWVYTYNRVDSVYRLAEQSSSGTIGDSQVCANGYVGTESVSNNGLVTFTGSSTNITSDGTTTGNIYIHNPQTGSTELLTRSSSDVQGNGVSSAPSISANGDIITYTSRATNLVSTTDGNGALDAFTSVTGY